jgi:hypothetical protein
MKTVTHIAFKQWQKLPSLTLTLSAGKEERPAPSLAVEAGRVGAAAPLARERRMLLPLPGEGGRVESLPAKLGCHD